MTPKQYQAAKNKLGLSHERLGRLIGISRRQSQRYALGERDVPKTVSLLQTMLVRRELAQEEAEQWEA